MRSNKKIPVWMTSGVLLALCGLIFSCGETTVIRERVVTEYDTIPYPDTVQVTDTLYDTLNHTDTVPRIDTFTVWDTINDTSRVTIGIPPVVCVGVILGDMADQEGDSRADSCYAHFSITSNPPLRDLEPSVNGVTLTSPAVAGPVPFIGGFIPGLNAVPDLPRTAYEAYFSDTSTEFAFRVAVPYYEFDTSSALSYDTVADEIALPSVIDTILLGDGSGTLYDSSEFTGSYATDSLTRRIPMDRDLFVSWQGSADWFGIECRRYFSYYGNYYVSGTVLDTVTTDTVMAIPHEFFYQDTSLDSLSYDFLYISVIGVNGPQPDHWDDLAAFGGKGFLISMRGIPAWRTVWAYPLLKPEGGVGKRAVRTPLPKPPTAPEILARIAARR